jgi:hypothetical protein
MSPFMAGRKIIIKSISNTSRYIGLDSGGEMRSMVGNMFEIRRIIDDSRVKIKSPSSDFLYTWHVDDLADVEEYKEPEPKIFKFDESKLVI